jgi:putative transposase
VSAQPQLAILPFVPSSLARPRRVALTDPEMQAQAESRLQIISPLLDYNSQAPRLPFLRLKDGTPVTSFTRLVKYTSETSGFSEGTIFNWLNAFREGGKPALADRQRRDKNTSRFFAAYPKAAWLAAYLYLDERASVRVAYEAIVRDLQLLQIPPEDAPSYETVRSWLKQMPPALTTYARLGRKAYRERMAAYLRRSYTDNYANQVWVGDHMIHDVECANDLFEDVEWGAPIRIRLSAMLDYRSRLLVGASWAWEGSSRAIAATMRRAIFRHGQPEHIYVDNGKDYRKIARGAMPGYLRESPIAPAEWWKAELEDIGHTGFCARLGIAVTHCLPHHPQSKHVERFFRTLHERFDKCWPTYTSGNPFTRPDATSLAMMDHRRLLRAGRVNESRHPLASRFILACLAWIEEYNATPHTGEGMDGCSPLQVFDGNRNPNQKPAPDPAALALLLAEREKRMVRECAVTLKNRRYLPVDQAGWMTIHEWNEREVVVAYDPNDWECAAALDLDGCFLAWLQVEELIRFAPGNDQTQRQIAESFRTRRGLEKATRETLTTISRVARSNGAQSPLEAMASRLELPGDVAGIVTQRKSRLAPRTIEPTNDLQPGELTDRLTAALLRRNGASNNRT